VEAEEVEDIRRTQLLAYRSEAAHFLEKSHIFCAEFEPFAMCAFGSKTVVQEFLHQLGLLEGLEGVHSDLLDARVEAWS
jgi:hypothetical protein